jgi:DNA-binding NtrC family response regulator
MAPELPADTAPAAISDRLARLRPGLTMVQHSLPLTDSHNDVRPLEDIEREAIRFAIAHYRGQMSEVARRLKIGR